MKIQFETGDTKWFIIGAVALAFILLSAFQYNRNKGLRKNIKENAEKVKNLKEEKEAILKSVATMEVKFDSLTKITDSIEVKETYYKNKYYVTNEKLKRVMGDFSALSNDDKWDEFTKSINN